MPPFADAADEFKATPPRTSATNDI